MAKTATTIDEQLNLLESRGLTILDKDKAREVLEDVGYYRLGFYLFPFEKTYPDLVNRTHRFVEDATFEDAVNLYYFDYDLRIILMRYLNRIELNFRTKVIYYISNKYKNDSTWFVNPMIVSSEYARNFSHKVYTNEFKRNTVISRHHKSHPDEKFAPAWKTMEFMTFGSVLKLYEELTDISDKIFIAQKYGIRQVVTFLNYMHTIRHVRNACAHGSLIYDITLPRRIRRGPANVIPQNYGNIVGALSVMKYILEGISSNRTIDMVSEIKTLYENLSVSSPKLKTLLPDFSTIWNF